MQSRAWNEGPSEGQSCEDGDEMWDGEEMCDGIMQTDGGEGDWMEATDH